MKTVICYESKGKQNVLKLVKAIEERFSVDVIDVTQTRSANLTQYDLVGFASETEEDCFYRDIASFAANWMPRDKNIFFLYTYPINLKVNYCEELEGTAHFKNCTVVGKYGCLATEGAGGFKLFAGKNKAHPNEEEIAAALDFFAELTGERPKETKPEKPNKPEKPDKPEKTEKSDKNGKDKADKK